MLVNLTPHAINLITDVGNITISPSGTVARCSVQREQVAKLMVAIPPSEAEVYAPVNKSTFGAVEDLPDPIPGTYYIVSSLVAQAARDRDDLLIPDDTMRDDQGRIIGCRAFARL